ncbi:hypothetical protein [Luteimonas sp. MHLX1A]|uniref:hypothetical protein n=1 Tax=Alterluteimonas muca TaxID=2878684 RepID=UPI001E580EB4|nr:hypothetical protein [Luteimonas sp. MHLX1A]MCD9046856.1 hypothetical protein [Luteimonas sp. MHLX1A]
MILNGLQRLGLLNSAKYSRAELPLDDACSLVGPNNAGKTSLINALQFVLIADGTRMNFGEHSREASRRFYFPTNASYVLAQLQLPDGEVVIGCVGKGHAHDYEYIAYKGSLNLDDFRAEGGGLVAQPQLRAHMAAKGRIIHTYSPGEFSDGLYGRNRKRADHEPNFNLFRLEHSSYLGVFQTVLTRTLRLDKLSSADVKRFLLEIFKHELTDAGIDFQAAWDRAFEQVDLDRAQYEAAVRMREHVLRLGDDLAELLTLRGKVLAHKPIVDDLLRQWTVNYKTDRSAQEMKRDEVREKLDTHGSRQAELALKRDGMSKRIAAIEEEQRRHAELADQFALIDRRDLLEQRLSSVSDDRDQLVTRIGNATSRPPAAIEREITDVETRLGDAQAALASFDDNLYLQLVDAIGPEGAGTLARLAHPSLLTLPPDGFRLDPEIFAKATTSTLDGERVRLPGLDIDAGALAPAPPPASREDLQQSVSEMTHRLARSRSELETAQSMEKAVQRRKALEAEIKDVEGQLIRFDEYQSLMATSVERKQLLQTLLQDLVELDGKLEMIKATGAELRAEEDRISNAIRALDTDNAEVERLRGGRRDTGPLYDNLPHLPHNEWVQGIRIALRDLPTALQGYINDCSALQALTSSLKTGVSEAHAGGLTKFLGTSDSGIEAEIQRMANFVGALPHEAETLERAARLAVVDVSSALVDLRRSLDEMRMKMREFNKLISQRRVSDLAVFKLELVEVPELVGAIDKLRETADHADHGESMALFDQKGVLGDDALNRAKSILIKEGQQNNGLKLENLFRLEFKVAKKGQAVESFDGLEASASLGTTLMAKLVIGLAMLHLMRDKRSPAQAVCYLDEAATLDPANQRSLIEAARDFGFALIFASPLPLTTARYCIPIDNVGKASQISRQRWQLIEATEAVPAPAPEPA